MASIKFDANAFKNKVMKVATDAVEQRLKNVRCPVHGQTAKVVRKSSAGDTEWEVSGCCKEFIAKVKASLKS